MFNPECVTCFHLGSCPDTDPTKVFTHFVCIRYKEVLGPEIVQARCDVVNQYGEAGLRALVSPDNVAEKEA